MNALSALIQFLLLLIKSFFGLVSNSLPVSSIEHPQVAAELSYDGYANTDLKPNDSHFFLECQVAGKRHTNAIVTDQSVATCFALESYCSDWPLEVSLHSIKEEDHTHE